eukprot:COSAG02_NODE_396_length_23126_cov_282.150258_4_plen_185_part_00
MLWCRILATVGFVVILAVAMYCGTRKPSKWAQREQELELQSLLSIRDDDAEYGLPGTSSMAAQADITGSSFSSYAQYMRSRQTAPTSAAPGRAQGPTSRYEFRMRAAADCDLPPPPPPPLGTSRSGLTVQQDSNRYAAGPVHTGTGPLSPPPSSLPLSQRPQRLPYGFAGSRYGDLVVTDVEDL